MDGTIYKKHFISEDSSTVILPAAAVLVEVFRASDRLLIGSVRTSHDGAFHLTRSDSDQYILVIHSEEFYAYGNSTGLELTISEYDETELPEIEVPKRPDLIPDQPTGPAFWRDAYFCGSNALLRIDALDWSPLGVTIIQWAANYNQSPLYSHNARFFDTVMEGQYLVEGGLGLNMQQAIEMQHVLGAKKILPLEHTPFNMRLEFALDFTGVSKIETYHFQNVHLSSFSHIVTPEGQPVGENYEFISRRVQKYDAKADLYL